MRGRLAVMLLVVGVLALVAVGAVVADRSVSDGTAGSDPIGAEQAAAADPLGVLDAALAEGQPAYVLIHSLT